MFRVRDTGHGVLEDEKEKVFERGYRGFASRQASSWQESGRGFGLSVAREVIHSMNGTITLESPSGIGGFHPGTTITVSFHRSRQVSDEQQKPEENVPPFSKSREEK